MKAVKLFFVFAIIAILTVSLQAQAKKDSSAVKKAKKQPYGLNYNKVAFDTLKAGWDEFEDGDKVNLTWGEFREILNLFHDQVLRDGDKRFMNMNGPAAKKIIASMDTIKAATSFKLNRLNEDIDNIAIVTSSLNRSVSNIETVVADDQTQVTIETTKIETKTMTAAEQAMQEIKANVAARRAAQQKK